MAATLAHREVAPLLPDDRFPADGALVKAWASMKSFRPKTGGARGDDGPGDPPSLDTAADDRPALTGIDPMPDTGPGPRNAEVGFGGKKRSNATHASTADPNARLYKKAPGAGAAPCFMAHALMENRSGLVVQADLTRASGRAERQAAIDMIHRHSPGSTRRLRNSGLFSQTR